MLTLQNTFKYQGVAKQAPSPTLTLAARFPIFDYARTHTDDASVSRSVVSYERCEATQDLSRNSYRLSAAIADLTGAQSENVGNFLVYTLAAMEAKRISDLSLTIPVEFTSAAAWLGGCTLQAIYLIKNQRKLFDPALMGVAMKRMQRPDPAVVTAFLDKSVILVNRLAYENALVEFKRLTGRNDDWLLLSLIQHFIDETDLDPAAAPIDFSGASSATLARILRESELERRDEIARFIAKHINDWFDFPLLVPAIQSVAVAGVFQVNTADGAPLTEAELAFYDLALEYSERGTAPNPTPRVAHYDWKTASGSLNQNRTPFSFAKTTLLLPTNLVGAVVVNVKGFDGTSLWRKEYDPNDPGLKEVMIAVSRLQPAVLTRGATSARPEADKRLRGQVLELTKKCPLKDLTVLIRATKEGEEAWRVVGAASTDASGSFSMPYPFGLYGKVQAVVSLTPDAPADVPIRDVGPNATIDDAFLYLLLTAPSCPEAEHGDDCGCDPKKAPRLPDHADLINSSAYTQDIGGSCVNLSTPNRTLNEFRHTGIVRTSDPDVANYTLVKSSDGVFTLRGDKKRIKRAAVDLDNPIQWQDLPDSHSNLTLYQAVTVATGHVLHYRTAIKADGYSLGDLLYSLALAPGQKKQIVVMDSAHSLQGAESQSITQGERLSASLLNERDIVNQLGGNINEALRGSSSATTSGVSAGLGVAANIGVVSGALGVAGGSSTSTGSATQNSSRDTSMFFGEKLRQGIMQNAESYRQLNASVVTAVREGQQYSVTTDVIANHNHCHALTMMYFEVLRHYAIFQELANVEECIFVPLLMTNFSRENISKWSDVLARNLLPLPSNTYLQPFPFLRYRAGHPLLPSFDANERIQTGYQFVDFPKGAFCDEPITSVTGHMVIRANIPRPKSVYDRVMAFPVVNRESVANRNGGGILGGLLDKFIGKRPDISTWQEKLKFADEHIVIYDNFQEARPADVIEVIKFDGFFSESSKDGLLWAAFADLCGYSDTEAFLTNFFAHKTISQWDATYNEEIAPRVFEALVDRTISIAPFGALDFTTLGKYNGGERLMRMNLRCETSLPRKDIPKLTVKYAAKVKNADAFFLSPITFLVETLSVHYTTKHYDGFIVNKYLGDGLYEPPPGPAEIPVDTPMNSDEQRKPRTEDEYLVRKLIEHLNSNIEHYNKVLWRNLDPDRRYMLLDGFNIEVYDDFSVPVGARSLASVVKNELLAVAGNSLVFPVAAGYKVGKSFISERNAAGEPEDVSLLEHYKPFTPVPPYRVSVPSKGVFLEAVQGACDACERVKEKSSQDWAQFRTDEPTSILPVTTPVPTITDWKAAFKEFAPPLVNIQNAPALPAPGAGLSGVTELLGKAGIFKDTTGLDATQQNVMRTYLSNQENARAFAEMAKSMAMQDHNTQHSDKIMESAKAAKDSGAINQDEYGKLVKDHIQRQIDGGEADSRRNTQDSKALETSPIKSAVDLAQRGNKVSATEIDAAGNTRTLDVSGSSAGPQLVSEVQSGSGAATTALVNLTKAEYERRVKTTIDDVHAFKPEADTTLVLWASEVIPPAGLVVKNWTHSGVKKYEVGSNGKRLSPVRRPEDVVQVILHETGGWANIGAGAPWTVHFTVGPDAIIYQHCDAALFCEHGNQMNNLSIGIEFTNWAGFNLGQKPRPPLIPSGTSAPITDLQGGQVGGSVVDNRQRIPISWLSGTRGNDKVGDYYVVPPVEQLRSLARLVQWLTAGVLDGAGIGAIPRWRQLIDHPSDSNRKLFAMTFDPRLENAVGAGGIIPHISFQTAHFDGSAQGLYTWLVIDRQLDEATAYATFLELINSEKKHTTVAVKCRQRRESDPVAALSPWTTDPPGGSWSPSAHTTPSTSPRLAVRDEPSAG